MQLQQKAPFNRRRQLMTCFIWGICLLTCLTAWGAEQDNGTGVLRSRVYKLKHISSEQARDFFMQLGIGQKYNTLTPEVLIVTSSVGTQLVKAQEVVNVIDQASPVQIQVLMTGSESDPLPLLDEFFAGLTSVTVGTMTEAPPRGAYRPVIVDVLDNQLIAIGLDDIVNEVAEALEVWKQQHPAATVETESPVSEITSDEPTMDVEQTVSEAEEPAVVPDENTPVPEEEEPVQETPVVEPNLSETADPVPAEQEPAEIPSLEQLAEHLFNQPGTADANDAGVEPIAEAGDEDFMSEALLEELDKAQEDRAAQETLQAAVTDEVEQTAEEDTEQPDEEVAAAVEEIPTEIPAEQSLEEVMAQQIAAEQAAADKTQQELMERLQALMAQSQQEEAIEAVQESTEDGVDSMADAAEPTEPDVVEMATDEPQEQLDPIQAEIRQLREQLAALEARAAGRLETANAKIQTAEKGKTPVTEPTFASDISEEELDTIMDLPQEIELESLVDLVGKQLGLNYMYDPAILRNQKVQLKVHGGKIKVKEVYSLMESVMKLKGFVMTRENQLVTIVKAQNADQAIKQVDPVIRTPGEPIQAGDIIVSTLFTLENIGTDSAKQMLTSLNLGMQNGFQEVPETGTLLVTDYAYRMGRIEEVLSIIDVPTEKKEYQFRTLKYMSPSEIVPKLQELSGQLEGVSLQITTQQPAAAQPRMRTVRTRNPQTGQIETTQVPIQPAARAATPAATTTQQGDSVYIDTDDRTNRILIAGKPDQVTLVNELIDALDVPQYDLKYVREYIIQNVEAQEIVDVINELGLASISTTAGSTTRTNARTRTPVTPAAARAGAAQAQTPVPTASARGGDADQPYISVRSATNSLLVNATAEQHKAIELAIAHVDVVQKDQRTIRQYEIQNVDAMEIISTLEELGIIAPGTASGSSSQSRSTRQTTQNRARQAQQPQQPGAEAPVAVQVSLPTAEGGSEKEITADQPQISVLENTNSLLVFATPRQHDAIALVIAYADDQPETVTTPYVVYNLENQNSLDLATTLNELIQETFDEIGTQSDPEARIQRSGAAAAGSNIPAFQEERPKVIGDEKSNSIIVYANKRNQQWISDLVKELDQNRYQVLLDVTLVEISKNDLFTYDLELISAIPDMTSLSGSLDYTIGRSNVADILAELEAATDRNRFKEGTSRGGRLEGFYGNDKIMALLDLMQEKGYGRVLNRPRILVNDNEPGVITLEEVTYRRIVSNVVQGTDNPVTTENVSYQDYSAGITLEITPHISQQDRLRLEIKLNRSTFVPTTTTDSDQPPDTINSDVDSVVTVPDESTVILGGLDSVRQGKGGSKVPILGDIPLIGGLFRSINNESDQRKIYIFVKANILRPGQDNQDLKDISEKNIAVFEHYEREMQGYEDWPGIKSAPIEPARILREEEDILDKLEADAAG